MDDSLTNTIDRLRKFRDARAWQKYHTPEALARAVAVESGELNELFLWDTDPDTIDVACEVADVMIYCLNLCVATGIDPVWAINSKIAANEIRDVGKDGRLQNSH